MLSYFPEKLLNASKDNAKKKILPKDATASEDKIKGKMLKDMYKSVKNQTLTEYCHDTKLPRNEDLQIEVKSKKRQAKRPTTTTQH